MQPNIFQGRWRFLKSGNFDRYFIFIYRKKKKKLRRENFGGFQQNTLKVTFEMTNLSQKLIHPDNFFPKSGYFFQFSKKKMGETFPRPPAICAPKPKESSVEGHSKIVKTSFNSRQLPCQDCFDNYSYVSMLLPFHFPCFETNQWALRLFLLRKLFVIFATNMRRLWNNFIYLLNSHTFFQWNIFKL